MIVKHKFLDTYPLIGKKTVIIGTFNPDVPCNKAELFYGRAQNHFWTLLPKVFGKKSLKGDVQKQKEFLANLVKLVELAKQRLIDNPNFGWESKKIVKLSENKEILKEYNSLKEYAEEHQCSVANVSKAIKKKQRCKGYYVEYLESYINV